LEEGGIVDLSVFLDMAPQPHPLWEPPSEPQPSELNLDTGSKKGISSVVASSPQKYSGAFTSKTPKLGREERARVPDRFYNHAKSAVSINDPGRKNVIFRSDIARFEAGGSGMSSRGMHPNTVKPQPSYATEKSTHLDADESYRARHGFFRSSGPRLVKQWRPLSIDLEPLEYPAGEHAPAGGHLTLAQTVTISPQRLKIMSSRSSRFTTALTYVEGETRNIAPLREAYDTGLGPGSFETFSPQTDATQLGVDGKAKANGVFASGSPRLSKRPKPLSVGGNTASVGQDAKSWAEPHAYVPRADRGLKAAGPQPGSFEDKAGLSRAVNPIRRSPDISYHSELSVQKRPMASDMQASPQRYSPAFRSNEPRLQISVDERRSLEYPTAATDPYDLSASASVSTFRPISSYPVLSPVGARDGASPLLAARGLACSAGSEHTPLEARGFGSTIPRFPPLTAPEGLNVNTGDIFDADRKKWLRQGQPLTANEERFLEHTHDEAVTSPGPGSYLNPRSWERVPEKAPPTEKVLAARRRLDL